jgi:hypothetical protein
MPRMEVGVGEDVFADTRRAVSVLVGMQRMSALPLDTAVVPRQQAIDSPNPAVIMAADGWSDPRITLPVSATQSGELKVAGIDGLVDATTLTLDPGQRFGSLQMVVDGERTVLIATSNGDPAQLDGLLAWLDSDPMRWSRLTGTAVFAPAGGTPVMIGADEPEQPVMTVEDDDRLPHLWIGIGIAAVVAVLAVGAGLIWWRSRSKTPSG